MRAPNAYYVPVQICLQRTIDYLWYFGDKRTLQTAQDSTKTRRDVWVS